MKAIKHIRRLSYISFVLLKKLLLQRQRPHGVRLRQACEELGPIFIKVGQILSTRADLLPEEIIYELSKLQDQVPPFSSTLAQHKIEKSLGAPLTQLFASFDAAPLASASIAQVHAATLPDGTAVVVKV
jgi:ubiquinone biosynthesis protein